MRLVAGTYYAECTKKQWSRPGADIDSELELARSPSLCMGYTTLSRGQEMSYIGITDDPLILVMVFVGYSYHHNIYADRFICKAKP